MIKGLFSEVFNLNEIRLLNIMGNWFSQKNCLIKGKWKMLVFVFG